MSNTPKLAPTAPLEIGGSNRTLKYDFNSLALLEEKTGRSAFDPNTFQNIRATDVRALVWAGLLHETPSLTLEEVGTWLSPGTLTEVTEAIAVAFGNSQKKDGTQVPLPEAGTPLPVENA